MTDSVPCTRGLVVIDVDEDDCAPGARGPPDDVAYAFALDSDEEATDCDDEHDRISGESASGSSGSSSSQSCTDVSASASPSSSPYASPYALVTPAEREAARRRLMRVNSAEYATIRNICAYRLRELRAQLRRYGPGFGANTLTLNAGEWYVTIAIMPILNRHIIEDGRGRPNFSVTRTNMHMCGSCGGSVTISGVVATVRYVQRLGKNQ